MDVYVLYFSQQFPVSFGEVFCIHHHNSHQSAVEFAYSENSQAFLISHYIYLTASADLPFQI